MRERRTTVVLAVLAWVLMAAVAAGAAPPSGVLATGVSSGPIAAYGDAVAWSAWDDAARGYRIVVSYRGAVRTVPVAPADVPPGLSAGPGPDGGPWLVWSRCNGDGRTSPLTECDLEAYDVVADVVRSLPFAARPGIVERAPSIWRTRVAYATGDGLGRANIHVRDLDGGHDQVVPAIPTTTCGLSIVRECARVVRSAVQSTALRDEQVAVASRVNTNGGDLGVCGLATVGIFELTGGYLRRIDSVTCALSQQEFADLSFDDRGGLWWRKRCGDFPGACAGVAGGPFRLSRIGTVQRLGPASASRRLTSVAVADGAAVLGVLGGSAPDACLTRAVARADDRCATVAAIGPEDIARLLFTAPRMPDNLPPSGYGTIRVSSRLHVLWPPRLLPCVRGSALPRPGAEVWVGVSWYRGLRPGSGPAVRVVAESGPRRVVGRAPGTPKGSIGQHAVPLSLGLPARACGRRWQVRYVYRGRTILRYAVTFARR